MDQTQNPTPVDEAIVSSEEVAVAPEATEETPVVEGEVVADEASTEETSA
jgi:hypothetical protein